MDKVALCTSEFGFSENALKTVKVRILQVWRYSENTLHSNGGLALRGVRKRGVGTLRYVVY